ncbi:GAF domain nucleotide-binding protein [Metarhizium album ARSEF 1941]|uniref:GAF domain nucleotide-binding protein n=1 Tax=Metarhizium album (strain ARSEF 1941) TaxID=1081103 RepID=A0A0B2WTS9_METAS|nr:GAF domain nucleotide-binding protein [Metarhizium album ARSEF 1941]KHN97458.1 GAF domain nucleotide-binding protein [Metarhizium album ARSEF 1941]
MTCLSLFGAVDSGHGLDQNDDAHGHHPHIPNHNLFAQHGNALLSSSLHLVPHAHQTPFSFEDPTASAVSQERSTANHVNHTLSSTSSSASSTAKSASGLYNPPRRQPRGSPVSSASGSSSKRKHCASPPADLDPDSEEAQVVIKRQRNTMAARKYRQKRLDRISDLESALGQMSSERDELKLQLARREAEVDALREMLSRK